MLKRLALGAGALLLMVCLAAFLAACGSESPAKETETAMTPATETDIGTETRSPETEPEGSAVRYD